MSINIQDPLFLLSAQTGMSAFELQLKAASATVDVNKPQEILKTGEPIPIIFTRRRNNKGGVLVQPKMTEAFYANPIVEEELRATSGSTTTYINVVQTVQLKYLLVLSEGCLPQVYVKDLFHGNCRRGTYNQVCNGRAGTWNPGNNIDEHLDYIPEKNSDGYWDFDLFSISNGESAMFGGTVYYRDSSGTLHNFRYKEMIFPIYTGTGGTYSGLTTLSFEYETTSFNEQIDKTISVFIRKGMQVTRLVDGVTSESDNYVDLVKYLFSANDRLPSDLIDNSALTNAAKFTDANGFLFNGELKQSENLLDWWQRTAINFLLRPSDSGGKLGLMPRLPYNTDFTIKTTQVTPKFTFMEEHVVDDGFEIEYISLEDRKPVCFVMQWRQQPDSDFGLVRTVHVRYSGEAANGPFVNVDMSAYCTHENHAVKSGAFRLAQRKYVTHHLRLTVRDRSYNRALTVGDLVRVRLRRETNEGEIEFHDKMYEINRIEKSFESVIVYDLTHFPIDSEGRSIVARQVAAAVGAGNDIDLGRNTFNCNENDPDDNSLVGVVGGGGGDNQPSDSDTQVPLDPPIDDNGDESKDYPYPYNPDDNNPDDPIDDPDAPDLVISGHSGGNETAALGDTLTLTPSCANPLITWEALYVGDGTVTKIAEGVNAFLVVDEALQKQKSTEDLLVYGYVRCPDPAMPGGYGVPRKSAFIQLAEITDGCPSNVQGASDSTNVFNVGPAFPASFTFKYTTYRDAEVRFVISGAASHNTGYVKGSGEVTIQKTSADSLIRVTVDAPAHYKIQWYYQVGCLS